MWPHVLWHFVGRRYKGTPLRQYEVLKSILGGDEAKEITIKLSPPNEEDIPGYTSVGFVSLTSLPSNTKKVHAEEYGKIAIGFNRVNLVRHCKEKGYCINPVFYAFKEKSGEMSVPFVNMIFRNNTDIDGVSTQTNDALYYLRMFTKIIKKDIENYNCFLEQEWRLVTDSRTSPSLSYPPTSQLCFGHRTVTESFHEEEKFLSLPRSCIDFVMVPNSKVKGDFLREYPSMTDKVKLFSSIK